MSNTTNAAFEEVLAHVKTASKPSELKITDIKICDLGSPYGTAVIKILTNQGLEGYGQVREDCSRTYAVMLKRLLIGENPCNVDMLFRRMKQFGWHSHQGGGVSGLEVALWDLAGKAYGVPVWQMLGGKFRTKSASTATPIFTENTTAPPWGRCSKRELSKRDIPL